MDRLKKIIEKQIAFNKGKNLFSVDAGNALAFINETIDEIKKINESDALPEDILLDYATEKALQEFCRVNQYYSFNSEARNELKSVYVELLSNFKNKNIGTEQLAKIHQENLKKWLEKNNGFARSIYVQKGPIDDPVACSEYSAEFQIEILHLDLTQLVEPILDLGCGPDGTLVNYLRLNKLEAYGLDRFANNLPYIEKADWLEYQYGSQCWGTIISNLGFSNHFKHHHLRKDGNYVGYAKKYMHILNSLKVGGCFHYTPGLPFIEHYLDQACFTITEVAIGHGDFSTSIVERWK